MTPESQALRDDIEALKAILAAERVRRDEALAELARTRALVSDQQAMIAHQKCTSPCSTASCTGRARSAPHA